MPNLIFNDENNSESKLAEIIRAEEYTRMYKWITEDFATHKDLDVIFSNIIKWALSVERRMSNLGNNLARHTHKIPEHFHAGGQGPNVGGNITLIPSVPSALKWKSEKVFKKLENTTGSKTNFENKVSKNRVPSIGDSEYAQGRQKPLAVLESKNFNKVIVKK